MQRRLSLTKRTEIFVQEIVAVGGMVSKDMTVGPGHEGKVGGKIKSGGIGEKSRHRALS